MKGRSGRWAVGVCSVLVGAALAGCADRPAKSPQPPTSSRPAGVVRFADPLRGKRWSGTPVAVGSLLHDDSKVLSAIDPATGRAVVVWRHPAVHVVGVSASPGGSDLSVTVVLDASDRRDASEALYLLRSDGSIELLDVVDRYRTISDPAFLRRSRVDKSIRVYWARVSDDQDRTNDSFFSEVRTRRVSGGPVETITARLRFGESIFDIRGYPGGVTWTVEVIKVDDDPAQYEVLSKGNGRLDTPVVWERFAHRAVTDSPFSVSWLSPVDYVVVRESDNDEGGHLEFRHFVVTCESPRGYLVAHDGTDIDDGTDIGWNVVPLPGKKLLVLTTADAQRAAQGASDVNWASLSVDSGQLSTTPLRWAPGPWTSVLSDVPPLEASGCHELRDHPDRVRAM